MMFRTTVSTWLLYGRPSGSWMGSPSMSVRRATTGFPLPIVATMPVFAYGCLQVNRQVVGERRLGDTRGRVGWKGRMADSRQGHCHILGVSCVRSAGVRVMRPLVRSPAASTIPGHASIPLPCSVGQAPSPLPAIYVGPGAPRTAPKEQHTQHVLALASSGSAPPTCK